MHVGSLDLYLHHLLLAITDVAAFGWSSDCCPIGVISLEYSSRLLNLRYYDAIAASCFLVTVWANKHLQRPHCNCFKSSFAA